MSRFWDSEVQKEDKIWSMMAGDYKMDFVHAILDQCEDAYVAVYAIQASAARIDVSEIVTTCKAVIPSYLGNRALLCGRVIRRGLLEGSIDVSAHLPEDCDELTVRDLALARSGGAPPVRDLDDNSSQGSSPFFP